MKFDRTKSARQWAAELGFSRQYTYLNQAPRPSPTFDSDGYPTDETLDMIKAWPVMTNFAIKDLLDYVGEAWRYDWPVRKGGLGKTRWIYVATGGWSGNESLIAALKENRMFWTFCWVESHRGGGFKFYTSPLSA